MIGQRYINTLFVFCSVLFILHQYLERIAKVKISALDNYLDPLLMMPILLWLVAFERRILLRPSAYSLPAMHIVGFVILVSLLAELVFPIFTDELIADPWDVCFYIIGGYSYALAQEKDSTTRSNGRINKTAS